MSGKRVQLLNAANKLFAEKGYHGFSMKELAQTANVGAGTIYLYFKNKEDLVQSLHQTNLYTLAKYMFLGFDEQAPLYDQFSCIWKNFWRYSVENPDAILSKSQFDYLPTVVQVSEEILAKELFKKVGIMLHIGVEQGVFKPLSIDTLATLSIETCANLARKHILGFIEVDDDRLNDLVFACWNSKALKPEV